MSYKLKKINTIDDTMISSEQNSMQFTSNEKINSLYLYTGHGEPIVADKARATMAHLHYNDIKEANKIKSDELSAYTLFTIPSKVEVIFFNKLGQAHDADPCDFEHAIINCNINDIINTFNQSAMAIDGKEKTNVSQKNGFNLEDITYVKYISGMTCANLEMNMTDSVLEYDNNGVGQYYEKYQKVGLYKYPLNPSNFFSNDCGNEKRMGLTTEHIYLSETYDSHFYDKYNDRGNPILRNNIDIYFHLNYIPSILKMTIFTNPSQILTSHEVNRLLIFDFFNNQIDKHTSDNYRTHISAKNEQVTYKLQSLQGSIDLAAITNVINNEQKTTLSDVCDYLSRIDITSEKIIILVITCRGDADMS